MGAKQPGSRGEMTKFNFRGEMTRGNGLGMMCLVTSFDRSYGPDRPEKLLFFVCFHSLT